MNESDLLDAFGREPRVSREAAVQTLTEIWGRNHPPLTKGDRVPIEPDEQIAEWQLARLCHRETLGGGRASPGVPRGEAGADRKLTRCDRQCTQKGLRWA